MSYYKFGYHWSIYIMNGLGLSIEATSSRATWFVDEEGLGCCAFSGIVIIVGCFVFTIGNPVDLEEIK
mgnify:FL=1|tara:strand:+ start:139 stop:342 length:204 start_codon:yes stop_codon:yes gene_type:complete